MARYFSILFTTLVAAILIFSANGRNQQKYLLVEISEPAKGKARQVGAGNWETAGSYIKDFASGVANAASSVAQGALNAFDKANKGNVEKVVFGGSGNTGSGQSGSGNMGNMG